MVLAVGACGSTPPPAVGAAIITPVSGLGQEDFSSESLETYRLRPSDAISVNVFREPDLSVEKLIIGSDGMISLPLVGAIKATGLTATELGYDITQQLTSGYLTRPKVSVNILEYSSHRVTVEGAVEDPGVYTFQPGAKLSAAVALADGPSRVAKLEDVAIFRETANGVFVAKFDYGAVRQGTMLDPVLEPGDRVVVGTSGLSQFWQDFLKSIPLFAVFTNAAR